MPSSSASLGPALAAAAALVKSAEEEAKSVTGQLDEPEREAPAPGVRRGVDGQGGGEGGRGATGTLRDLEDRQKSRATRVKRDSLDRALLDLASFYRDVLMIQADAEVELANSDHEAERGSWRRLQPGGDAAPHRGDHALPRAPGRQRRPATGCEK